ncbi:class C sortase [Streptomyces sp. AC495_CC817]|uniref:class C sortase n=1 Tax=Streptomyces sp. AC495_CC817 TaxID=2823900 RepID=UPI001C270C1B|nr:class C sortase [Streptomyces sp. AC495_CC817]
MIAQPRRRRGARPWRPSPLSWVAVLAGVVGAGVFLYPHAAAWTSAVNQAQIVAEHQSGIVDAGDDMGQALAEARAYNDALTAGVDLEANSRLPTGVGSTDSALSYENMLSIGGGDVMARIRIPKIGVDLPVFHGTSDATLLKGAGHLQGSHLPVGGEGTHAVITAHRGLADATMFSDLDGVGIGDRFTIEVLDQVLTYEIVEKRVVAPEDTDSLRPTPGADLVTLVTCTPLGINTHRILVTGARVTPTPEADVAAAGRPSGVPGFPWWLVAAGSAVLLAALVIRHLGFADAAAKRPRYARTGTPAGPDVEAGGERMASRRRR